MSRSTALSVTLASILTFSGCGNRPSYNSLSQKETPPPFFQGITFCDEASIFL